MGFLKFVGSVLRGLYHSPWLVGLLRGAAEIAVMGALVFLAASLGVHIPPEYAIVFWGVVRFLEGLADQIDPAKRRAPEQS